MEMNVKFGIMCTGTSFQKWQGDAIKQLLAMPNVTAELLIIDVTLPKTHRQNLVEIKLKHYLWFLFSRQVRKNSKAVKIVNLDKELTGIPNIKCQVTQQGKFSQYFDEWDIDQIKSYNLDFILRFAFGIIRGEILNSAKFGVWSYHHDDETKYRGGPPGFWEIYKNDPVTGSILQRLNDKLDAGTILKKGYFKTLLSYTENRDNIYMESSKWPAQVCQGLLNRDHSSLRTEPSTTTAPIYYAPNNLQTFRFLICNRFQRAKAWLKSVFVEDHWNIGIAHIPIEEFLTTSDPDITWYPLSKRSDRFYADPFGFVDNEDVSIIHIFIETYKYSERKGFIEYTNFKNGIFSEPIPVIDIDTHLSYPFSLKIKDKYFLIPENCVSGEIPLYVSSNFPHTWKRIDPTHQDLPGIDSTVVEHDGSFWMFTCDANDKINRNQNLYLFFSDDFNGPWTSHPMNPVKTDVRSTRSAGTPFHIDGTLYRPSMDYSEKYQWHVAINEVKELSKTRFEESEIQEIKPYSNTYFSDKTHTLSSVGDHTLVDGAKEVFLLTNWTFLWRKVQRKLRKHKLLK